MLCKCSCRPTGNIAASQLKVGGLCTIVELQPVYRQLRTPDFCIQQALRRTVPLCMIPAALTILQLLQNDIRLSSSL